MPPEPPKLGGQKKGVFLPPGARTALVLIVARQTGPCGQLLEVGFPSLLAQHSLLFTAYPRDHLLLKAFLSHSVSCYQPLDILASPFNPRRTSFLPYPCLCDVVDETSVFLLLRNNCRAFYIAASHTQQTQHPCQ